MKTPKIKCRACNGKGAIELPAYLEETLNILSAISGGATTEYMRTILCRIYPLSQLTRNAINNRLEKLRALGLVTRDQRRVGKFWIYRAK